MKFFRGLFFISVLLLPCLLNGQTNTYILNGAATQNSCNCYTLTPALNTQSGSVWNANKIDLRVPFNFVFNVFLGCTDANGADGIVFMLQPISTSIGSTGGGLGFGGISPSVGIVLDTWQNIDHNDPVYDHISIQANGNLAHGGDLSGPVQAALDPNIEDCEWHTLRVTWDPSIPSLRAAFDGIYLLETNVNLISTLFNNDPMVYWGFSAGTGGSNNLQRFCTALNPNFNANTSTSNSCIGTPVNFSNESQSFSSIASYYWDLGDGTISTLQNPPPHLYAAPGKYEVKLAITALDGCRSDTMKKIVVIGDYPVAEFDVFDTCTGFPPRIIDRTQVQIGPINKWEWELDGQPVSISEQPILTGLTAGTHDLQLISTSIYGCRSGPVIKDFFISQSPVITASADNGCLNKPLNFTASQVDNATFISGWNWDFGDGQTSIQQNAQNIFASTGNFNVTVTAEATNGCTSETGSVPVFINEAIANAGRDTIAIQNIPFQLSGSGGVQYSWSPALDLDDAGLSNPTATLSDDEIFTLTVTTAEGCEDSDEVVITVFKGSAIYVPTGFTPNNDGLNELLRPYYVGIRSLEFFTVYNRWGEMIFTTKDLSKGWDGIYKGTIQPVGTYVWMLKAADYVGKVYELRGTSTIIR